MIEVEMNKDIRQIEPKVILGLSGRQLTCACAGIGIGLIAGLLVPGEITIKAVVGVICGGPILLCGFVKVMGLSLDKFVLQAANSTLGASVRKYESKTAFGYLETPPREIKKVKREYKGYK